MEIAGRDCTAAQAIQVQHDICATGNDGQSFGISPYSVQGPKEPRDLFQRLLECRPAGCGHGNRRTILAAPKRNGRRFDASFGALERWHLLAGSRRCAAIALVCEGFCRGSWAVGSAGRAVWAEPCLLWPTVAATSSAPAIIITNACK